jgi:hypothetical protein
METMMTGNREIQADEKRKAQSPAVQSLKQEQDKAKTLSPDQELEKGLKDSFPASDPISVTSPSVTTGRVDPKDQNQ